MADVDIILQRLQSLEDKILALPQMPQPPEIINSEEVCRRLGISQPTLTRWRIKKKIPSIQQDGIVRFNWVRVIEALENNKKR